MISVALKEWSAVCDLLSSGEIALVLRKGGILEDKGPGMFELEHKRFVLFPSWLHQRPDGVKPAYANRVQAFGQEPPELTLTAYAEAARIWEVPSREAFDSLDDLHPYGEPQIEMRFNYKPEKPLYLVALRVHQLAEPKTIANRTEYGGCRSWVPLAVGDEVDQASAEAVMSDDAFAAVVNRVDEAFHKQ